MDPFKIVCPAGRDRLFRYTADPPPRPFIVRTMSAVDYAPPSFVYAFTFYFVMSFFLSYLLCLALRRPSAPLHDDPQSLFH